jgi:hypothetical protein
MNSLHPTKERMAGGNFESTIIITLSTNEVNSRGKKKYRFCTAYILTEVILEVILGMEPGRMSMLTM